MSSYWEQRSLQRMLKAEMSSEEAINKIINLYSNSLEYIQNDINKIMKTYVNNGNITKDIAKVMLNRQETDLFYKNLLKTIDNIQNKNLKNKLLAKYNAQAYAYRISRLEALKEEIYVKIKEVADIENIIDTEKFKNIINYSYYNTIFDVQQNIGYAFEFSNINDNLVNVLLADKWIGKGNYSSRIWNNTEMLAQQLQKTLASNLIVGRSINKMAKELEETMNVATYNAVRLIRTEANYFCNQAELLAYKESDVEEYVYLATLDTRTCSICGKLDLKTFKTSEAKTGINYPPIHANDRCTTVPKVEFSKLKTRIARDENGKNIKVPVDMNYNEWKAKYADMTDEEKDAIREYSSSKAYTLNEKLRNNLKLDREEQELINNVDKGLNKLPNYNKVTYRQIGFDLQGKEEYNNFINQHENNTFINYGQYTSTSKNYNDYEVLDNLKVEIEIEGKTGKDIRGLVGIKEENEVLFKRDTWFKIIKVENNKIWLKEK